MRKNVVFSLIVSLCVVMLSFACVKTDAVNNIEGTSEDTKVITVAQNPEKTDKVLETRFLNMLNHNYVYNDAFYDDAALVNDSMPALLDWADGSFVDEERVSDYVFNMYGKIYSDYDFLGTELPKRDGAVYIIPRGYDVYTHKIVLITDNNDGSFTVKSNVTVSYIDGTAEEFECETVFLKNAESAFGYNIMYSEFAKDFANESAFVAEC